MLVRIYSHNTIQCVYELWTGRIINLLIHLLALLAVMIINDVFGTLDGVSANAKKEVAVFVSAAHTIHHTHTQTNR